MQRIPGVVYTAAGYTQGGRKGGREGGMEGGRAPTYSEVCSGKTGFVEAVEVLFDQRVVSYHRILEVRERGREGREKGLKDSLLTESVSLTRLPFYPLFV